MSIKRIFICVITFAFCLFNISGCVTDIRMSKQVKMPKVFVDKNNEIHFNGIIDSNSVDKAITLIDVAVPPKSIHIESLGGEPLASIKLGTWIKNNNMDVVVTKGCASSCANYVLTAAKRLFLSKSAVLIWHGGSYQDSIQKKLSNGNNYVKEWREVEDRFFALVGVDYRITIEGFSQIGLFKQIFNWLTLDPVDGFDYCIDDLKKFGIVNIELMDLEWNWRRYNKTFNVFRADYLD